MAGFVLACGSDDDSADENVSVRPLQHPTAPATKGPPTPAPVPPLPPPELVPAQVLDTAAPDPDQETTEAAPPLVVLRTIIGSARGGAIVDLMVRNDSELAIERFSFTTELFDRQGNAVICEHKAREALHWERLCVEGGDAFQGESTHRLSPGQRKKVGFWPMAYFPRAHTGLTTIIEVWYEDGSTWRGESRQAGAPTRR